MVAAHDDVPDRVPGFHAHLAAKKAFKSLRIQLGIEAPRVHDLVRLQRVGAGSFPPADLEVLNPWTIEGRYPADPAEVDDSVLEGTPAAARRVIDAVVGEAG